MKIEIRIHSRDKQAAQNDSRLSHQDSEHRKVSDRTEHNSESAATEGCESEDCETVVA